jgi:protease secretion system membrane fusion protein
MTSPTDLPDDSMANTGRAARLGLWVLALGLGGFVLWAGFAPLDEGVPSPGMVTIDTKRKAVQHLSGGIIRQVLVKEGQLVQQGQVVIQLDDAVAKSNYESVRQRYLGLRAAQARLLAEQTGRSNMVLGADLQAAQNDPLIQSQIITQSQLLAARRAALKADMQAFEASIQGQQSLLITYANMLSSRRQQLALLNEELRNTAELVKEGYAPRNRQLELERQVSDASASIAELLGNLERARHAIAEQQQRSTSRQQEYRKEVEAQLSEVLREVQSDAEKFPAVKADLERIDIKAPASGQVVGLAVQTVGAVVQAGQKLMDIVPENEPLLLEARIDPHLIDRVHTGLATDVRFSAFSHSPQLVVSGEVVSISKDLLMEQVGNNTVSYYLARVKVLPDGMKALGERQMQPGMPVEIVIKTGERSMLTYLLRPLLRRIAASMKEE